ncbi:cysteine hydrolase family protein [Staphylospora marina]|uniref:cysteine hydrolase family protein n=1 Tax=Staphylospora marina TaxID=2490858 RepID=UPI0013DE00E8|nr:isochorismatase family protein [Staphylospora marina]
MREQTFIRYLKEWAEANPELTLDEVIRDAGGADHIVIVVVDVLKGFCETGPLSSERVAEMVTHVSELLQAAMDKGVPASRFVFLNDSHPPDAVEFSAFPPHCIRGTEEAEVVEPLQRFASLDGVRVFRKNATNGLFGTDEEGVRFFEWLENVLEQGPATFLVVGDCTDLCIYQNATGIRLFANEQNARAEVIVPASHSRTYDLPVDVAIKEGIAAHDADFLDLVFLYHMHLNGIRVLRSLRP